MKDYLNFTHAADYCARTYGTAYWKDEQAFICPECAEPLYFSDNQKHDWNVCPICEFAWYDEGEC